jgi:hypothetical protein
MNSRSSSSDILVHSSIVVLNGELPISQNDFFSRSPNLMKKTDTKLFCAQRFLMHLLDMDDPPFLTNDYSRPSNCKDNPWIEDCIDSNGAPLPTKDCYDCHFGDTHFSLYAP